MGIDKTKKHMYIGTTFLTPPTELGNKTKLKYFMKYQTNRILKLQISFNMPTEAYCFIQLLYYFTIC